jgi:hypothetical protein
LRALSAEQEAADAQAVAERVAARVAAIEAQEAATNEAAGLFSKRRRRGFIQGGSI